jgi:hypothetical protein
LNNSAAPRAFNANERQLKDKAHVLVRRGKLEAATEVYLVLITQNPKDPSLRIHHAELCDKLHRSERAIASYQVAAHLFELSGHKARARAAISCGLRIAPRDPGLLRALRDLTEIPPPVPTAPELTPPHLSLVPARVTLPGGEEWFDDEEFLRRDTRAPMLKIAEYHDIDPFDPQEAVTDPYCPLPDWAIKDSLKRNTVSQRRPAR